MRHQSPSDATLLAQLCAGEERGFRALYLRHAPKLVELAAWLSGGAVEVGEDIVHDIFLDLWTRRSSLALRGEVRLYLYQAVRNRAANQRRHQRTVDDAAGLSARTAAIPAFGTPALSPDAELLSSDVIDSVERVIETLPHARREAVTLYLRHDFSYAEIAKVMGISHESAKMHVMRARAVLRPILVRLLGLGILVFASAGGLR